jgi:hypothetical protein
MARRYGEVLIVTRIRLPYTWSTPGRQKMGWLWDRADQKENHRGHPLVQCVKQGKAFYVPIPNLFGTEIAGKIYNEVRGYSNPSFQSYDSIALIEGRFIQSPIRI